MQRTVLFVAIALIVVGVVLLTFTFLLAFTIFGEIALILGVASIAVGAAMLGRRARRVP